jgi:signal transduction histidine kinase
VSLPSEQPHAPQPVRHSVATTVESLMLEERTRWAMRVHDGLTQSVTCAVLEIQTLRHRIETDPAGAIAELREVEDAIRHDLTEIREVLFELHEGRARREQPFAAFVAELVERWRLPARVAIEGDIDDVPTAVLDTAQHIVAEALTNAAKHSGSKDVSVRLRAGAGELRVEVEDRGHGIAAITDDDPHFGLRLMQARAAQIGGSIEIESTPGRGVCVIAVLPVGVQGEER